MLLSLFYTTSTFGQKKTSQKYFCFMKKNIEKSKIKTKNKIKISVKIQFEKLGENYKA